VTQVSDPENRSLGQRLKRTVETKVLIPLAATVVSASVSYLAKKLPLILEEKVLPKLRESGGPEKVTEVVEQAAERFGGSESAPEASENGASGGSSGATSAPSQSDEQRDEERRRREERRQERKRALKAA
jgi:hypothetical protein